MQVIALKICFCSLLGKSSLKKTVYGEYYDPKYRPTLGIDADPSITRITFKQYKEWILQNASKADAHRLNLEYIDIIIDYVLSALQQPRVSDNAFDVRTLHIEKDRVLKVDFNPSETVIPEDSMTLFDVPKNEGYEQPYDDEEEEERGREEEEQTHKVKKQEDHTAEEEEGSERGREEGGGLISTNLCLVEPALVSSSGEVEVLEGEGLSTGAGQQDNQEQCGLVKAPITKIISGDVSMIPATPTTNERSSSSTSVLPGTSSFVHTSDEVRSKLSYPSSSVGIDASLLPRRTNSRISSESTSTAPSMSRRKVSVGAKMDDSMFRAKGELSRLLVENIPREILKRMVIRWPVGDEQVVSRAELNKQRLMITVWDVSGDPLQHNFTPFFFSHRCLFVSTYNLTRGLDGPCESFASKNLRDLDGRIPTNAEALEDWLGYVTAFSKPMPSVPFRCSNATPVLPPVILACSFADKEEVRENPISFHNFFSRESFSSYRKHLVEGSTPSALIISSKLENEGEEDYAGHNLLRREIDYLARQMPFCTDNIPIQWVKFEQLIYGLQEQKKIILLYDDLTRYVSEHCKMSGTLQILPVLSHFHDVGVISYFYRHPLLSNIIITKPQWLADALSSVIVSSPSKWVTAEVQIAFAKLAQEGLVSKEMLLLAYRCGRMHQRYWNETLFILNCMDLTCCHPTCHSSKSLYAPCLVTQAAPEVLAAPIDESSSSTVLHFSSGTATFPIATYNQLVVRCVRSCQYAPKLFYCTAHLRLNSSHHLILSKHHTSISIQVQHNHDQHCHPCLEADSTLYPLSQQCAHIRHIMGEDVEYSSSDNIATLINLSTKLKPINEPFLMFQDDISLAQLCPGILAFIKHHLNFLTDCWFPGLRPDLLAYVDGNRVVLDQYWKHTTLNTGTVSSSLRVWFK